MRIALLTALAEEPGRGSRKAAFRPFVGRSVLSHQIDCARALDCDMVLCMIRGLGPEAIVRSPQLYVRLPLPQPRLA